MQSKTHSIIESVTSVAVGYLVALATQAVVFPLYGITSTIVDHASIAGWFTAVSLMRTYLVRRAFNGRS